jgi:hypothetical protein
MLVEVCIVIASRCQVIIALLGCIHVSGNSHQCFEMAA